MYENKKILILGAGKSGLSVAKLLSNKNNDITLSDVKDIDENERVLLESLGIKVVITKNQCDLIDDSYDLVIKNPAIMFTSDIVKKLNLLNIRTENEIEVAYHFLPKNVNIIGVTGSNGKTTTTTIIYELLKLMKKNVVLAGNIGMALCSVVDKVKENDILLLEISDHHLCDIHDFKTNISVLTNICQTHLDYHGSYEHYKLTKGKIFNKHTNNDMAIINYSCLDCLEVSKNINSKIIYFNDKNNYVTENGIYLDKDLIISLNDIKLKGIHNYENILAALVVLKEFGFDKEVVRKFLKGFNGVSHRLEFVREINDVSFYNDSKSTNPTSTVTALKTFNQPIHLILGGLNRNQSFDELDNYLGNVKIVYAIGEVTDLVNDYCKSKNIKCYKCFTLKEAMKKIKENIISGDVVLLSPGSASQDQYLKFEDRGDEFKNLVENF